MTAIEARPQDRGPGARLGLFAARAAAWSLLLTGWLALGSLGAEHAQALALGAALPLVLWLLGVGALLQAGESAGRWAFGRSPPALAGGLVGAGLVGAGSMLALDAGGRPAVVLPVLALAWAVATVCASHAVRWWRARARGASAATALPSPASAAALGGVVAWLAAGDLLAVRHASAAVALTLLGACAVAATLALRASSGSGSASGWGARPGDGASAGCRAGLFDCSLPLPAWAAWRRLDQWPLHAAALAMLPMMVALPAMAQWCGLWGWSGRTTAAVHLAAMLLPGALAQRLLATVRAPVAAGAVTALLASGLGWALVVPGLQGLMGMSLLHAVAWSLAWGWQLAVRAPGSTAARLPGATAAALTGSLVLALVAALATGGPAALPWVHGSLAVAAMLALASPRPRARR